MRLVEVVGSSLADSNEFVIVAWDEGRDRRPVLLVVLGCVVEHAELQAQALRTSADRTTWATTRLGSSRGRSTAWGATGRRRRT